MAMDFVEYVRKPFVVEAVEITIDNIEECAQYIGELKEKEDGNPYIMVDRKLVPNVFRVFPGYFMTRMGDNIRCYSRRVFHEQFVAIDDNIKQWVNYLNGNEAVSTATPVN